MSKPKTPKTYFEQVPLVIVKKIAKEEILDGEADATNASVGPPAKK